MRKPAHPLSKLFPDKYKIGSGHSLLIVMTLYATKTTLKSGTSGINQAHCVNF